MTEQEKVEFAARIRAHVSTLAETDMEMTTAKFNAIADDLLTAADIIQGCADTPVAS